MSDRGEAAEAIRAKFEEIARVWATKELVELRARVAKLEAALPVIEQMMLEVEAAIHRGPSWYTRGERGMADQVLMHVRRVRAALKGNGEGK